MKQVIYSCILLLSVVLLYSCTSTKKVQKNENNNPIQSADSIHKSDVYRLIVSFISIGEGRDEKLKLNFDAYIVQYEKTHNKILTIDKYTWGREGEIDYCFWLNNLTQQEQSAFIEDAKKIFGQSKLVFTKENELYKHNR